jgi:hypothetical protein
MTVVIQDNHFLFADQKVPIASDAVVESGLAPEQRAIGERPDRKLVAKASYVLL